MQVIIDLKQGYYHKQGCEFTSLSYSLNQNEHDFRKGECKSEKELEKRGWRKCPKCGDK